jgi:SAM-dependent methyltransferase
MGRHWWYRGRAAAVLALARRARVAGGGRVLDYGCGTGHMGPVLARFGEVWGVDDSPEALARGEFGAYAGVSLLGDEAVVLPAGPFSLIACLDVLEHVADDAGLLRRLKGLLAPGGALILSVPMRPALFCSADEQAGHVRRYTRASLARAVSDAGLCTVTRSGYVVALLPAALVHRRMAQRGRARAETEFERPARPINALLGALSVAEGRAARFVSLPAGLSELQVLRPAGGSRCSQTAVEPAADGR